MSNKNKNKYGSYHVLARYYDELMNTEKYEGWISLLERIIEKYDIERGWALDLACGTGKMSNLVNKAGFNVVGIDNSKEMLEVAREKYPSLDFIKADMRSFDLKNKNIKLAFSFYDSLNYLLTKEDLLKTFKNVRNNIVPSSFFVFDINPLKKIKACQNKCPQVVEKEGCYVIFRHGGEEDLWTLDMDFFVQQGNEQYILKKERHVEKGYSRKEVEKLLKKADFNLLEVIEEKKDGILSRLYFVVKS